MAAGEGKRNGSALLPWLCRSRRINLLSSEWS